MKQNNSHTPLAFYAALSLLILLLPSCSMMQDDRSDCPDCHNPLRITLRYDYNTQRANMFGDHVEEAAVYVVDAVTGNVVDYQTTRNSTTTPSGTGTVSDHPLRNPSFAFNFEGLTPGRYRLFATGRSAADAAFSTSTPDYGEAMSKLHFTVPTDNSGLVPTHRLDTIWNTLKPVDIDIPEDGLTEATVPLMRLTNDLSVVVFRRDGSLDNSHDRYDVTVTDETLTLGYDNEPEGLSQIQPLQYHPFAAWTTETVIDPTPSREGSDSMTTTRAVGTIAERNAHYDLSLFRLLQHDDARRNTRLIITNRATGHEIVNIDLCYYLALARNAYETQHYSIQEYLDREYDYRLDFGFEGEGSDETWKYMTIHINVLSWAFRIQNETL